MTRSENVLRARDLRRHMTPPELRLWVHLRGNKLRGLKFRRQHPIGPFILDFFCAEANVAVEVDGNGHFHPDQIAHDRQRTIWLHKHGVRVVRIAAEDVRVSLDDVLDFLARTILERRSN